MARLQQLLVGTAAAILSYQLILPPVVALADNGDFARVIGRFDLWAKVHKTYIYSDTVYVFDGSRHWAGEFYSTEIPLAAAAIGLNSLVSKDGNFDIRVIGCVHSTLFLLALWLFAPVLMGASRRARFIVSALVLLFYCDLMYVAGLNSFYMDEPAYLFLLLSIVFYLRAVRWGRPEDAAALIACAALMAGSKTQHVLLAFWISSLLFLNRRVLWRYAARWQIAACLLPAAVALFMLIEGIPRGYSQFSVYNVTFEQILPHAKDPARTLGDLGLDDSYRRFIGQNAYWSDSRMDEPAFEKEFSRRLNMPKLLVFYMWHPRDVWLLMMRSLNEAGCQHSFGTFDISAGYAPGTESRAFRWWSDLKNGIFFHRGRVYFWTLVTISAVLGLLLYLRRGMLPSGFLSAGYFLIGMTFTELAIASLADSMDIVRHYLIFYALFDLILVAAVALAVNLCTPAKLQRALAGVRYRAGRHVIAAAFCILSGAHTAGISRRFPFQIPNAVGYTTEP